MRKQGMKNVAMVMATVMITVFTPALVSAQEVSADTAECLAEVEGGTISGTYNEEGNVAIYKGIPYAAPPVGELRWKAPQPVESWDGVKDCTQWGASAILKCVDIHRFTK